MDSLNFQESLVLQQDSSIYISIAYVNECGLLI